MLYDSPHVRAETADGIATVWLEFPGTPVNALSAARLAEVDRALAAVLPNKHLDAVVIRSGRPAGFCGGADFDALADLPTDADRAAYAVAGQRVLSRLAAAEAVTVAFIEGPCLGPGLELALACDYRLAVAGPDSRLGFPDVAIGVPPCWGGAARVGKLLGRRRAARVLGGSVLTAREAARVGLVDDAFSARRGRIELWGFLDRVRHRPRKRTASGIGGELAAERAAFRHALGTPTVAAAVTAARQESESLRVALGAAPGWPIPDRVGLVGTDARTVGLAVEVALRGGAVAVAAGSEAGAGLASGAIARTLAEAVGRGRATPLEADQARGRVWVEAVPDRAVSAGWVVAVDPAGPAPALVERQLRPGAVFAVPADRLDGLARHADRPGRFVGLGFLPGGRVAVTGGAAPAVGGWLYRLGFAPVFPAGVADAARRAA